MTRQFRFSFKYGTTTSGAHGNRSCGARRAKPRFKCTKPSWIMLVCLRQFSQLPGALLANTWFLPTICWQVYHSAEFSGTFPKKTRTVKLRPSSNFRTRMRTLQFHHWGTAGSPLNILSCGFAKSLWMTFFAACCIDLWSLRSTSENAG